MSKRLFGVFAATMLLLIVWAAPASAHVLEVDGSIGAVLHIQPDDNPTVGHPTIYVFSFSDDKGTFQLSNCDCRVTVVDNDKDIDTQPLSIAGENAGEGSYTFTKPGVYTLRVNGAPKHPDDFPPFTLDYAIRASDNTATMQSMPPLLWAGMGMFIGLILLGAYAMDYSYEEAEHKEGS